MNWRWEIEEKEELEYFFKKVYENGSFALTRKKDKMAYLLSCPHKIGRFSQEEDRYLLDNYLLQTRLEMAMALGRMGLSVKNRLRKLGVRKKV